MSKRGVYLSSMYWKHAQHGHDSQDIGGDSIKDGLLTLWLRVEHLSSCRQRMQQGSCPPKDTST